MKRKQFDAVAFMRRRRDELSLRWKDPKLREEDLARVRRKYKFSN